MEPDFYFHTAAPGLPEPTCGICGVCESWHPRTGCEQWTPAATAPSTPAPQGEKCAHAPEIPDSLLKWWKECDARFSPDEMWAAFKGAVEANIALARERESRKQAEDKAFNAGIEAAAKECDEFVLAYSFWTPYPKGYVYSDAESKAAAVFAKGRFEVAAKKIRGLESIPQEPAERERGK
jgi:hypothetical protein